MAWQARSIVDQRAEFASLAAAGQTSMAELCRRFGISRQTGYIWLKRWKKEGKDGMKDRSRRPKKSPSWCGVDTEKLVLDMRAANPAWGGRKIRKRLKVLGHTSVPAASTITGVLHRHGLISATASASADPLQRFEREHPNELWQMDFKGPIAMRGGACHALTVLDDHSRYSIGLWACQSQHAATVREHLESAFTRYGLPWKMLADNGSPWRGCYGVVSGIEVWLLKLGVVMIHGRPYHPQTQGKEERFHRTLNAEVLRREDMDNHERAQRLFDRWRDVYNIERPHEALGLEPPVSRYRPSERSWSGRVVAPEPCPGDRTWTVKEGGYLRLNGHRWYVGDAWDQEVVGLRDGEVDGVTEVRFGPYLFALLDGREGKKVIFVRPGGKAPSLKPLEPDKSCVNDVSAHLSTMSPV